MPEILHAVEAALFSVIVSGAEAPVTCHSTSATVSDCGTRGVVSLLADGSILLPGRIRVDRNKPDVIVFSTGVTGRRGATGWISFSNGLTVRREGARWRFAGGLTCAMTAADQGNCR